MPADLAALDELFKAATPGEWRATEARHYESKWPEIETADGKNVVSADCNENLAWVVMAPEDAAFIAAVHNAWPSLLRRLRQGDAARAVLEAEAEYCRLTQAPLVDIDDGMEAHYQRVRDATARENAARAAYRALMETPDA